MKTIQIFRDESFKISQSDLGGKRSEQLLKRFTYHFFKEKACSTCENIDQRPNDICESCAAYEGSKATAKKISGDDNPLGVPVISVPRGAKNKLKVFLQDMGYTKFVFKRSPPERVEHSRTIKLVKKLRDYQEEAVQSIMDRKQGVVESPPRSGKTLIMTAAICRIGEKSLILAHQRDWLNNFLETFLGSPTQERFTNASKKQVGFARKLADFDKYDVCLATFQQFMSPAGKALLEKIKDKFTFIGVDEVHNVPALQSARVLSRFNFIYSIGLSGTPARKAGDYVVAEDLVGPVIYKSKVDVLRPKVDYIRTPGKFELKGMGNAGFTYLISKLENNVPRRRAIIEEIIRRAEQGHLVLVPLTRVNAIQNYLLDINERMGAKYALPFFGGMTKGLRTSVIEDARNYKCKVIVGNIGLLQVGMNIPRASCLLESGVNSNLPKAQQRFSRILTPMEGKPHPLIVFTLDECDIMRGCRRNEYWQCLKPKFNPIVLPEVQATLNEYYSTSKKNRRRDIDLSRDFN